MTVAATFAKNRLTDIVRARGFMRSRWHKVITLLAVAAIAAANCYGAPALAGHHTNVTAPADASDPHGGQHDHTHGDHAGHAHDSAPAGHFGHEGVDGSNASSVCCTSMTCAAVGIVASQGDASPPLRALPGSLSLDDAVQTAATAILDPPPRTR